MPFRYGVFYVFNFILQLTMYYTGNRVRNTSADFANMLVIPSLFTDYVNRSTCIQTTSSGKEAYCFHGDLYYDKQESICPICNVQMHIHKRFHTTMRHLSIGNRISFVMVDKHCFMCPKCRKTRLQKIPFQAENHRITEELLTYTEDLLKNSYTNKQVSELTGLGQGTVKAIDQKRLKRLYCQTDDPKKLIKPERQARVLSIDEFKLHNGYKYATHIIDLETGHVLWIQAGKKKQVVYDFIDHVGLDWMDGVEAVACDMNSDFQEAFEEKCPHIQIVFDYFHIVKNFNDKVISAVRKDEYRRLCDEGDTDGAKLLKKSKYILTSKRSTLQKKDQEATQGKEIRKKSDLFHTQAVTRKNDSEARYDELLAANKLLFTADLVKAQLADAYHCTNEPEMAEKVIDIIDLCTETNNLHFLWFARLLTNHFEGIIAHASIPIASGKIEGINNKIKTLRRQAYGYPDDEYFFLQIMDCSRKQYVRNPQSHQLSH